MEKMKGLKKMEKRAAKQAVMEVKQEMKGLKKMEKRAAKAAVMEVKQELQRVRVILKALTVSDDDDELELQIVDSAIHALRALKELELEKSYGGLKLLKNLGIRHPPQEFLCPISGLLMTDPLLADLDFDFDLNKTYDKESLSSSRGLDYSMRITALTNNRELKQKILMWCVESQVPFIHEKGLEKSVEELRRELQRVTGGLVADDVLEWADDDAVETLCGLRDIRMEQEPPLELLCPISVTVMDDPVVIASGQTYDERNIKKWLDGGRKECPKTDKHLSHTLLIPNLIIKEMVSKWSVSSPFGPTARLLRLLARFPSLYYIHQKAMLREIRLRSASDPSLGALLTDISPLLAPSVIPKYHSDAEMYNDVLATISNISIDANIKSKIVRDCPSVIPFLIEALGDQNFVEYRGLAAASLGELSAIYENMTLIGESGGVGPLIELLELGHPLASREAAGAVLRLCSWHENKIRALVEGGIAVFIKKLDHPDLLSVLLEILASFCGHRRAVEIMEGRGLLPRLFRAIEETRSGRDVENCLVIISALTISSGGSSSKTWISKIEKNVENAVKILDHVAKNGTVRAKEKGHEPSRATKIAIDLLLRIRGKDLPNVKTK